MEKTKHSDICYFYILNNSNRFTYEGKGMMRNDHTNEYVESQTEKTKPGYITVKALESPTECAISGLNGAYYKLDELQHVYFTRNEGNYVLQFRDRNRLLRFIVKSGKGYFIVNSNRLVEMESNFDVKEYDNRDDLNLIEMEALKHNEFIQRKRDINAK